MTEEKDVKTKMVYVLVKEGNLQALADGVQARLDMGYAPIGGAQYMAGYYVQTLIGEVEVQEEIAETPDGKSTTSE